MGRIAQRTAWLRESGSLRPLVAVLPAMMVLAAFACSDYAADEVAPPATDGGADSTTAPVTDASSEETGPPPSSFCAKKGDAAVWCEDFDTITDVTSLVPESSVPGPGLSAQTFVSGPRSLQFMMPAMLPSPQHSVLTHGVATDQQVRLEVDWRWPAATESEGQTLQSLTLRKDVGQAAVGRACGTADAGVLSCPWYIAVTPDVSTPSDLVTIPIPPPAALKKWAHVVFQVRFANLGHVLYEEDGIAHIDQDIATLKGSTTAPTSATIGLAILQGSTAYHEMFFDNVFVELR